MLWDTGAALQHADTVPGADGARWDLAALYSQTAVKKKGVLPPTPHRGHGGIVVASLLQPA